MIPELEYHPERINGELCIGNFAPHEIDGIRKRYDIVRVGKQPYNHDGTPKNCNVLKPVFVSEILLPEPPIVINAKSR